MIVELSDAEAYTVQGILARAALEFRDRGDEMGDKNAEFISALAARFAPESYDFVLPPDERDE